ncbi:MAG: CpaF family protein [Lachnospiraceae bacterium]|nr:CpaF family protein [Lachnospiraceae bacterium]
MEDQDDEALRKMIAEKVNLLNEDRYIPIRRRLQLASAVFSSMRQLDIIQEIMDDKSVTEIMVNGMNSIFIEKNGTLMRLNRRFDSRTVLDNIIQQIVGRCNRVVNESNPIVDARLEDGSRVNVVLNPVALNEGAVLTIRRFPKTPLTMDDLIDKEAISREAAEVLKDLVIAGYNVIVSGGTGSGKTTFLNCLSAYIPADERIITIEDSAELQIQGIDNLVRLETRNANVSGCKPITIRDLIRSSLRMRPDRIIVGEVRGEEAMDMVCSAMNCGHDGSMSTLHSNTAVDALARLQTMILMAADIPVMAIKEQISSGVDIIVHLGRLRDNSRKVLEIVEVVGMREGRIDTNLLYCFEEEDCRNGKIIGKLAKKGELINETKLKTAGL